MPPGAEFSFNKRELNKFARDVVREEAKKYQRVLDSLHRELAGQPVDTIKPRLARAWRTAGGTPLKDPSLTEWATAIANGNRVIFRAD
jgi:hypothetical protein